LNEIRHNERLEVAYRQESGEWANQELLDDFLRTAGNGEAEGTWFLARWNPSEPPSGGLVVRLYCPAGEETSETFRSLTTELHQKLSNGLAVSTQEKGWPIPRFSIEVIHQETEESWAYQLKLGPFQSEPFELHPNKILAVGEETALSSLLGLEALDPVFGLPAKWVTFSQSERAAQHGTLLFEAAEVAMGHAINFLSARMEHALGLWELSRWVSDSLPYGGAQVCEMLSEDPAFFLKLVRELVSEGLHLPPPEQFCEFIKVAEGESSDPDEVQMLVRKEVVNGNITFWLDEEGLLNAVEWKGPEELNSSEHHRMLDRLCHAVEQVSQMVTSGRPVLLVNVECRRELASSLKGLFPELPVLAWSDLKDLSNIRTLVSVNSRLSVDPPAAPTAFFSTTI
jgi:flagellar biosynthesis component FlhA